MDRAFRTFLISLVIHGLLAWLFLHAPPQLSFSIPTEIEVTYGNKEAQRIVMDDSTEHETPLDEIRERAKNLSRLSRRVKEEQVARPLPEMQKRSTQQSPLSPQSQQQPQPQASQGGQQEDSKPLYLPLNPQVRPEGRRGPGPSNQTFSRTVAIGGGTQGEWIPGVKEGSFTALNTDQFTYYSFFARVGEAIRFRWIQGVRNFSDRATRQEIMTLNRIPSPTNVQVTLNKSGDILKVAILKTSGSAELDQAAEKAFWAASPLNNPPTELAEEDGFIRLYYSFQVFWQSQSGG